MTTPLQILFTLIPQTPALVVPFRLPTSYSLRSSAASATIPALHQYSASTIQGARNGLTWVFEAVPNSKPQAVTITNVAFNRRLSTETRAQTRRIWVTGGAYKGAYGHFVLEQGALPYTLAFRTIDGTYMTLRDGLCPDPTAPVIDAASSWSLFAA